MLRWLIGLELFLAVAALGGAATLVFGGDIGSFTDRLPFHSPVFGGLALAVVVAVPAAVVAVGALTHRPWARAGHLVVGIALMGWIVVQVAILGFISALQPAMFTLGAVITGLAVVERRRRRPA